MEVFELHRIIKDAPEISMMRNLKEQKSPPFMLLKHLRVHSSGVQPYAATLDDLLWLFPRMQTALFKSCPSPPKRTVLIKLKYRGDKADDQENCWWHQLLEVTIKNIEGGEECLAPLKDLFENKRDTDKIIVHIVDKHKLQRAKSFQEHKGCYTVRKDRCSVR